MPSDPPARVFNPGITRAPSRINKLEHPDSHPSRGRRLARYRGCDKGEIECTHPADYRRRVRPETVVRSAATKRRELVANDVPFPPMQIPFRSLRALLTSRTNALSFGTNELLGTSRCRARSSGLRFSRFHSIITILH